MGLLVADFVRTPPDGASCRSGLCRFIRSHRSCIAAGIAVLLSLVSVALAPLTFINNEEMEQLANTVDALHRELDKISELSTKQDQDNLSHLYATLDALARDLDRERNRTSVLEQLVYDMRNTTAAEFCGKDGGTLAMPRDAETNTFLLSISQPRVNYWIGLHDRQEEGKFEWVDGSALGKYNKWAQGQPDSKARGSDCVSLSKGHDKENIGEWDTGILWRTLALEVADFAGVEDSDRSTVCTWLLQCETCVETGEMVELQAKKEKLLEIWRSQP
ncbi:hypothetical protein Bbelb_370640 [Branchiostoma belcheri]|nr:hypothetical protein Bbelb_370640 [Branchiostoma belcheri]